MVVEDLEVDWVRLGRLAGNAMGLGFGYTFVKPKTLEFSDKHMGRSKSKFVCTSLLYFFSCFCLAGNSDEFCMV